MVKGNNVHMKEDGYTWKDLDNSYWEGFDNAKNKMEKRIEELETRCNELFLQTNEQVEQIKKMKRHCNCKHRDSEGYCEVKRTYLIDLSYDGCDKWELED